MPIGKDEEGRMSVEVGGTLSWVIIGFALIGFISTARFVYWIFE